jgi:DNA-binding NarL/FixJ family response regulator
MKKTRILLADDHSFLRMGLRTLLAAHKDFIVVGETANGREAVDAAKKLKPNIIIMDLMMPIMNGAMATKLVREVSPETKVIILTTYGTSNELNLAIENGAFGVMMKDAAADELIEAIRTVAAGGSVIAEIHNKSSASLSGSHHKILSLVAQGFSNPEIANFLGLSEITIKKHLSVIHRKLGVANRAEAVALALREGFILNSAVGC